MRISKSQIEKIIQEEIDAVLSEANPLKFLKFLKRGKKAKNLPVDASGAETGALSLGKRKSCKR